MNLSNIRPFRVFEPAEKPMKSEKPVLSGFSTFNYIFCFNYIILINSLHPALPEGKQFREVFLGQLLHLCIA